MPDHHVASQLITYTHAFRIGLSFEDDIATIADIHRVAMRAPASAPDQPADGQAGMWVELRGEGGHVLYHRALRTPHLDSVEVFEEEKTGAIRRVPTARPKVIKLDVIVPDLPGASELRLYGAKNLSEAHKPSVVLLHLPMRELRRIAMRTSD